MNEQEYEIVEAMEQYGGGFVFDNYTNKKKIKHKK